MNKVARMGSERRSELFSETGNRLGLAGAIVEKDFWVCWTLLQVFSIDSLRDVLLFKGGTSLSKVFQAISRFSEDIDLAVDYVRLGFVGDRDPRQTGISRSKQTKLLAEMLTSCADFIRTEFVETLRARFTVVLGRDGWTLEVDPADPHVVRFTYPRSGVDVVPYIVPSIILELGTHAEFIPRERFQIRSLASAEFPALFEQPNAEVTALLAKRTFWEKVTILHAEFHRHADKPIPARYSRHYYDLAMLAQSGVRAEALADGELLRRVVTHKQIFYPSAWARYDLAVPGAIRLSPPNARVNELRRDYRQMSVMLFGEPPSFDWILRALADLERTINDGILDSQ